MSNSTALLPYLPLALFGLASMPLGHSFSFYLSAAIAAVLLVGLTVAAFHFAWVRHVLGWLLLLGLLAMAVFIIANLPPYQSGGAP